MKKANISKLKSHASELLKAVKKGEVVRIYDRNEPIADIIPIKNVLPQDEHDYFKELEREGVVKLPQTLIARDFVERLDLMVEEAQQALKPLDVVGALIKERKNSR